MEFLIQIISFWRLISHLDWQERSVPIDLLPFLKGSVRVAEQLALPTSDHGVTGLNPAEGEILPEPSLHRAFHVHPPIVSKCLKYCWRDVKP